MLISSKNTLPDTARISGQIPLHQMAQTCVHIKSTTAVSELIGNGKSLVKSKYSLKNGVYYSEYSGLVLINQVNLRPS